MINTHTQMCVYTYIYNITEVVSKALQSQEMHHQSYLYVVPSFLLYTDLKTTSHMFRIVIPEVPELLHNFGNCISREIQSFLTIADTGKIWFDEFPNFKKNEEKYI